MALVLETSVRDVCADAIDAEIGNAGYLEFQTGAQVEVATITFGTPSFGPSSVGVITMTGQPLQDTNATGNASAIDAFQIFTSVAALKITGTVTLVAGGGDIEMSSLTVAATDTVELTTFSITVPA